MDASPQALGLLDRLAIAAAAWSEATGRTLGALSSVVTNHGGFFDRIGQAGAGASTTTLEKFARFLADPANWPDGAVPDEAVKFAHVVGITPAEGEPSRGNLTNVTPDLRRAQDDRGEGRRAQVAAGGSAR